MNYCYDHINIQNIENIFSPNKLKERLPLSKLDSQFVKAARKTLCDILDRKDHRLLVVLGPCSIHDLDAGVDYARRLKRLADKVSDKILLVMRGYIEKPRTTFGWKGLVNDPYMDNSFSIKDGVAKSRKLFLEITKIGMPLAVEIVSPCLVPYLDDLISWLAVGARTVESQVHREMASGISMAVGFKNTTNGHINSAVNAIISASRPHSFLGLNSEGKCSIIRTKGNNYCHIILRGGGKQPNFSYESIRAAENLLCRAKLPLNIVVDCSHGNSNKNHEEQTSVLENLIGQISNGCQSIIGVMIESFIAPGNQSFDTRDKQLIYGCSVTDPCVGWDTTVAMINDIYNAL